MKTKKPEELNDAELDAILIKRFGFESDEIETLYPDTASKCKAVQELDLARQPIDAKLEDEIGWDEVDKPHLTKDQKNELKQLAENRKKREELLKTKAELEKKKAELETKVNDQKLEQSIQAAGNKVTVGEVKKTLVDLNKLLAGINEELDD